MSKVSIKGNQNGTGNFTIEAPNSNSDRTFALPDEAGTVLTDTSDIESQVKTATNATGSAPVYACRAWVNFELDTLSIRDSGNISSVTDVGNVGDFLVNFTTSMPDSNFSASGMAGNDGRSSFRAVMVNGMQTNGMGILLEENNGTEMDDDIDFVLVTVFR